MVRGLRLFRGTGFVPRTRAAGTLPQRAVQETLREMREPVKNNKHMQTPLAM